jgi:16S rRNA (adenine1518-N6/adenine1519-N6)-dimethyltransferase
VVRITFHPVPARVAQLPPHDPKLLRRIVNAAFGQRRKTLRNSLSAGMINGLSRERISDLLSQSGINPETRAERLTIEDFVRLTNAVANCPPD